MRAHPNFAQTERLPNPNQYVGMLKQDFASWTTLEDLAPRYRGQWREQVFKILSDQPLDLEIGTGNGFHFAHRAKSNPQRYLLGLELKYKPLVQSIRRALKDGSNNAHIIRYHAGLVDKIFAPGELNDVFIHFPDPWSRVKQAKHRLLKSEFLSVLFELQKSQSVLEFKTDNRVYFDWALENIKQSRYQIMELSYDLHMSPYAEKNFVTHFESIFLRKGQPIHYALLLRK